MTISVKIKKDGITKDVFVEDDASIEDACRAAEVPLYGSDRVFVSRKEECDQDDGVEDGDVIEIEVR